MISAVQGDGPPMISGAGGSAAEAPIEEQVPEDETAPGLSWSFVEGRGAEEATTAAQEAGLAQERRSQSSIGEGRRSARVLGKRG